MAAMRAWIGVILIMAGCGKDAPAPVGGPAEPEAAALITPGRAPLRVLRYAPRAGTKARIELVLETGMTAGPRTIVIPPIALELELAVERVDPDGRARIRTTVVGAAARPRDGANVPEPVLAQMTNSLRGAAFSAMLGPDGRVDDVKLESSQGLPPSIAAQLAEIQHSAGQVAMRLPHEPVGVGATWTTRRELPQQGVRLIAATTTTVTAIDGDRVSFSSITTLAAPDRVQTREVMLTDAGGGGTRTGTVDLVRLTMDSKDELAFHGTIAQGSNTARIEWKVTMTTRPVQGAHSAP